jgi:hypothetical protein
VVGPDAGVAEATEGRRADWLFVRIFLVTFPAVAVLAGAIGVLLVATTGRLSWVAVPGLIGIAAALSAVHAATELASYPLRVEMRPSGLSLTYAKFTIEAPWEDWTPIARSRMTGGIALRARWGTPKGYLVSPQQALRIARYPSRPPWPEGEELFPSIEPISGRPNPP